MKLEIRAIGIKPGQKPALPHGFGVVAVGELAALVEVITPGFNLIEVRRLRRYQMAINLWWNNGKQAILPVRAGSVFDGPEEIGRVLQDNAYDYKCKLEQIGNKLEMNVRFAFQSIRKSEQAFVSGQNSGRAYIEWLSQRQTHEDQQLMLIDAAVKKLSGLAVDYQYYTPSPGATFAEASFLLLPDKLDDFRVVIDSGEVSAVVTGPFPPYDFI
jgi:hypothetical protein